MITAARSFGRGRAPHLCKKKHWKEIQNTTTDNIHMAEERGFKVETDFDEEDLYSGVLTKDGKQRHEKVTIAKKPSKDGKSTAPKKTMNYAAAAAKADTTKTKSAPPGFSGSESSTPPAKNDDKKQKSQSTKQGSRIGTVENYRHIVHYPEVRN